MFKKMSVLFIAFVAAISIAGSAKAAPVYYIFEGTIDLVNDAAGAVAAAGLSLGSTVSYTLLIDRALPATYSSYNGTTYTDVSNSSTDAYYVELVSQHPLSLQNGGYAPYMTGSYYNQYNNGYEQKNSVIANRNDMYFGGFGTVGGNIDNRYQGNYISMASWTVGTSGFFGNTTTYNEFGWLSTINSRLTITGISSTNPYAGGGSGSGGGGTPVPEPSTLLLLGSGLAGLGFIRRRLKI